VEGYWINGPALAQKKAAWAREQGMLGVMLWEAGQDSLKEDLSIMAGMYKGAKQKFMNKN
jgi:uncharacterized protein YeaC (DUF1315 family)